MKENKWLFKGEFKEMKGIILESRSGAKSSSAQRNPNYKLLLRYALETLKKAGAKNVEIYVAGKRETKYPNVSDRLLFIDGESKIDFTKVDVDDFIPKLSKQMMLSGQTGAEKGGNSTKRLFFQLKQDAGSVLPTTKIEEVKEQKTDNTTKEQILKALEDFNFEFKRPKKHNNTELKELVADLQINLKNNLETTFVNLDWQIEYNSDSTRKDSIDIYGYDKVEDTHIVIELDPHRADSISKKFVSRLAMMADKNLLYIAYLYPGTEKMPKNEANKYLLDCETILNALNANTDFSKQFLGVYLEA